MFTDAKTLINDHGKLLYRRFFILGLLVIFCSGTPRSEAKSIDLSILPGSDVGALYVNYDSFPGDTLEFGTCEILFDGAAEIGRFLIKLKDEPNTGRSSWHVQDNTYSYEWLYEQGVLLKFSGTVLDDELLLNYTIVNLSDSTLEQVHLHPCTKTTRAPSFFPDGDFTKLYDRGILWSDNQPFSFSETEHGYNEIHLAVMKKDQPPLYAGWWIHSEQKSYDIDLLAVTSKDNQKAFAFSHENTLWASINTGDERACVHLFPYFGRIEPRKATTILGKLYLLEGDQNSALERYQADMKYYDDLKQLKAAVQVDIETLGITEVGKSTELNLTLLVDHAGLPSSRSFYLDLSGIAEPAFVDLSEEAPGRFRASAEIIPVKSGKLAVPVMMTIDYPSWNAPVRDYHLTAIELEVHPDQDFVIYADQLAEDWAVSVSGSAESDVASTEYVRSGEYSHAISIPGGALLYTPDDQSGISLFGYSALQFYICGGENSGQNPKISSEMFEEKSVRLANLGVVPEPGVWKAVSIPIIGVAGKYLSVIRFSLRNDTYYIDDIKLVKAGDPVNIERPAGNRIVGDCRLYPNFPNPFNPVTNVRFEIPEAVHVKVDVYNLMGQELSSLVDGRMEAGSTTLRWDGRDRFGNSLGSGVYIFRMKAGDFVKTQKAILLR